MGDLSGPQLEDFLSLGQLTIGAFLEDVADRYATNEALVFDDPFQNDTTIRWTYDDLRAMARRIGTALLARGVRKGSRVGLLMANRPEAIASFFGAAMAGAVVVPLSTFSTAAELTYLIDHADLSVLLMQTQLGRHRFEDDLLTLCPELSGAPDSAGAPLRSAEFPHLRHVIALGPRTADSRIESWESFLSGGEQWSEELLFEISQRITPSDLGLIIYSSGTTDHPKGILHNHQAPTLQFWVQAQLFARDETTRLWAALPMFWTAGLNTSMGSTFAGGGCWILQNEDHR